MHEKNSVVVKVAGQNPGGPNTRTTAAVKKSDNINSHNMSISKNRPIEIDQVYAYRSAPTNIALSRSTVTNTVTSQRTPIYLSSHGAPIPLPSTDKQRKSILFTFQRKPIPSPTNAKPISLPSNGHRPMTTRGGKYHYLPPGINTVTIQRKTNIVTVQRQSTPQPSNQR